MIAKKEEKSGNKQLLNKEYKQLRIKKKRKIGRPKKRGPKKKRIRRKLIKVLKPRPVIDFKIVSTLNGKQNGYVGSYRTYSEAYSKLKELEEDNKKIIFPRKYLNSGIIGNIKDEYILLEKNRFGDKSDGMLRNELGKFVKHIITNNTKWLVRDKVIRLVEETFWVYGYDCKNDRKTAEWIYKNLIIGMINASYDIVRILVYKNKLIIKYDDSPLSMVMCKNKSDAIRLYNFILEKKDKNRIKQVLCIGSYNVITESRKELEQEIINLTGWDKRKIQRSTN
jgi:hypothetical protein